MKYPEPLPLGISDPQGHIGAITPVECEIDLIDLVMGRRLRRLSRIGGPLMIDGPMLIGWQRQQDAPHQIRLFRVPLSPADGTLDWSAPVDLPGWVRPQAGFELDFGLRLVRDGGLYQLYWTGRLEYRGGAPPPRELAADAPSCDSAERIDFDAGTLKILARRDYGGFADEHARARRGEHLARHAGGFIYRQGGRLLNAPWATPSGERYLRAAGALGEKGQRLVIARAGTLDAHDLVEIDARDVHAAAPELSLDGQHLAVVVGDETSPVWGIFSTAAGDRVGAAPYRNGFGAFRVFDHRLICLEENAIRHVEDLTISIVRRLHAINLEDGSTAWTYPIDPQRVRDMSFLPSGTRGNTT